VSEVEESEINGVKLIMERMEYWNNGVTWHWFFVERENYIEKPS